MLNIKVSSKKKETWLIFNSVKDNHMMQPSPLQKLGIWHGQHVKDLRQIFLHLSPYKMCIYFISMHKNHYFKKREIVKTISIGCPGMELPPPLWLLLYHPQDESYIFLCPTRIALAAICDCCLLPDLSSYISKSLPPSSLQLVFR